MFKALALEDIYIDLKKYKNFQLSLLRSVKVKLESYTFTLSGRIPKK